MRVLVTGAGGFVGGHLLGALAAAGHRSVAALRAAPRGPAGPLGQGAEQVVVGPVDGETRWDEALDGVDAVIHLVARTHVLREDSADPETAYRTVNVDGTRALVEAARRRGVERVVYMSSIKVNGEATTASPYGCEQAPAPEDAYGRTKRDAERVALEAGAAAVLRSPLVYGPGVKANFLRLLAAVDRQRPLPIGLVSNRRSLVYVENLCSALVACAEHPRAAGEVFIVSDGEPLSTPELVRRLARALGRRARLVPVPVPLLTLAGAVTGRSGVIRRLTGSLEVDDSKLRAALGWRQPVTLDEGLARTARWYLDR